LNQYSNTSITIEKAITTDRFQKSYSNNKQLFLLKFGMKKALFDALLLMHSFAVQTQNTLIYRYLDSCKWHTLANSNKVNTTVSIRYMQPIFLHPNKRILKIFVKISIIFFYL